MNNRIALTLLAALLLFPVIHEQPTQQKIVTEIPLADNFWLEVDHIVTNEKIPQWIIKDDSRNGIYLTLVGKWSNDSPIAARIHLHDIRLVIGPGRYHPDDDAMAGAQSEGYFGGRDYPGGVQGQSIPAGPGTEVTTAVTFDLPVAILEGEPWYLLINETPYGAESRYSLQLAESGYEIIKVR